MLKIKKLTKQFNQKILLENISYEFRTKGFYTICGESGSGKSTLLNILSTIDEKYEKGQIFYKDYNYDNLNESEKRQLRLENFGFVFQSFNLLENDTVLNNLLLVIDYNKNLNKNYKLRKIDFLLESFGILNLKNEYVLNLSGGEKQRVAIVRSLINSPKVIFCDEPTGSLDKENSENIFQLLKDISKNLLVICVTHDRSLAEKYSDYTLLIENKKMIEFINENPAENSNKIKILNETSRNLRPKLTYNFIFKHLKSKFKMKKTRYSISSILISFSLVALGVALLISLNISTSLKNAFSSIIGENSLILSRKNSDSEILSFEATNKKQIEELVFNYKNDIEYYGTNYLVNFEEFFKDRNVLYNVTTQPNQLIPGFGARHFNEFTYINDCSKFEIYPSLSKDIKLEDDEIILGLNFTQVKNICLNFKIVRSYESLANFIKNNDFLVCIYLANSYWTYSDEITFKVRGIIPTNRPQIYHTNSLFNEIFFEDVLRFPSTYDLLKEEELPWMLKKIHYLKTYDFQSVFLNKLMYDPLYKDLVFDSETKEYSPQTCPEFPSYTNKIYVYSTLNKNIDLSLINLINSYLKDIESYYFSSSGGYINYGTSLFVGFANPMYLTLSKEESDYLIDSMTLIKNEDLQNIVIPDFALSGYVFNNSNNQLKYKPLKDNLLISGSKDLLSNEVILSKGILEFYGIEEKDILNKKIYLTLNNNDKHFEDHVIKEFKTISLNVAGVVLNDYSYSIYQSSEFSISLFRDLFKESAFNLLLNSIIFETKEKVSQEDIKQINSYFDEYELVDPMNEINESINEVLFYLEIILYSFSLVTIISSIIVLAIINLINIDEDKKEIAILTLLGFDTNQILKMEFINSLSFSLISFITSGISIVFINYFIFNVFKNEFGYVSTLTFPTIPLVFLFLTILFMTFISLLFIYRPIKNINLIKNLH